MVHIEGLFPSPTHPNTPRTCEKLRERMLQTNTPPPSSVLNSHTNPPHFTFTSAKHPRSSRRLTSPESLSFSPTMASMTSVSGVRFLAPPPSSYGDRAALFSKQPLSSLRFSAKQGSLKTLNSLRLSKTSDGLFLRRRVERSVVVRCDASNGGRVRVSVTCIYIYFMCNFPF